MTHTAHVVRLVTTHMTGSVHVYILGWLRPLMLRLSPPVPLCALTGLSLGTSLGYCLTPSPSATTEPPHSTGYEPCATSIVVLQEPVEFICADINICQSRFQGVSRASVFASTSVYLAFYYVLKSAQGLEGSYFQWAFVPFAKSLSSDKT